MEKYLLKSASFDLPPITYYLALIIHLAPLTYLIPHTTYHLLHAMPSANKPVCELYGFDRINLAQAY
jgi:hypothetical protein